jgi:alpha-tubulin suppressor-like RCC1 family protein
VQLGTAEDWVHVERGNGSACALNASGAAWCWGAVAFIAGIGTPDVPTLDPARSDWARIAVGLGYACGITQAGDARCWGSNDVGQVGDGSATRQTSPRLVRGQCERLAAGAGTTFAIFDGGLYSFGSNEYGVRGVPVTPRRVGTASDWSEVALGLSYSCGIRGGGELYCWGSVPSNTIGPVSVVPQRVGVDAAWSHVDVGWGHACGLRAGELHCWGRNERGALGDGTMGEQSAPQQVGSATDWLVVSASDGTYGHTCGIRAGGALYCWGSNDVGQVGDGTLDHRSAPTLISTGWSAVVLGDDYSCGIRAGALYCWGGQSGYQLGNGVNAFAGQTSPVRIGARSEWERVSAGYFHACGLDGGGLSCWGNNAFGQQGRAGADALVPLLVDSPAAFERIASGVFTTCATTVGSALVCWGSNASGELGSGGAFTHGHPFTTLETSGWQTLAAGAHAFCGIRSGALYCWGRNERGALGHDENLVPGAVVWHSGDQ